jgi:glycerol-3-phosphate O-acyltransferase
MGAVGRVIPVVPVPLVASVFVERPDAALSELEVKAEVHRLMLTLEAAGANVYIPRSDREYAIVAGLRMLTLRHLVEEVDGLYRARPDELHVLRYYANSIAHLPREAGQEAAGG